MSNIVILGAQWGDEGKGKLVDLLAGRFDYIVRYQGGHNAGHTILIGDRKFVLRLVPSGILHPGKIAVIGNGLVVDPLALLEEVDQLIAAGIDVPRQLRISNRAQVVIPTHRLVEKITEANPAKTPIGTTLRGMGPCYEDKAGRRGPRSPICSTAITSRGICARPDGRPPAGARRRSALKTVDIEVTISRATGRGGTHSSACVCDTAFLLAEAMRDGKNLLFEGAQGTMLDLDHGTYPLSLRPAHAPGGACTGTGVPPAESTASSAFRRPI